MGNPLPSDDGTRDTKDESEASEGANENPGTPRSLHMVVATEPADFFEKYWGMKECVDEHPFEDYDKWFHEGDDTCDADEDGNESDFHRGD
jgi:hypothetical protein